METRDARFAVFGVGAVLLPFALAAFFVWLRTGGLIGFGRLFGDGDLFPPIAVFAAQTLAALYGAPAYSRNVAWIYRVGVAWVLFAGACLGHAVPYADGTAFETRLAWTSLGMLVGIVLLAARRPS